MDEGKKTLYRLLIGNGIYVLVVCVIGFFLLGTKSCVSFFAGVVWSGIGSCIVTVHLYRSLNKSLDMEEEAASEREKRQAFIRMIIMILVVGSGLVCSNIFHPVGVVMGAFALKGSVYLQPIFHKYILKEKGGRELE